jgi:hypothetical protein
MATAKQITQEIIDWNVSEGNEEDYFEGAWRNCREDLEWSSGENGIALPSGKATFVKSFGGEGKGEEYWILFKVGEELFKVDGYYSSWDGVSWDNAELYKVAPVEVTVIEYQKVDE